MRKLALFMTPFIALVMVACGSEDPAVRARPSASAHATDEASSGDSSLAGGTSMTMSGSCVEEYSIENLKHRTFAFDGTITSIQPDPADGPDTVAFDVATWFKGGDGSTATKQAYGFGGVMTSAGGAAHAVGDHLLVAGDDEFVWECGFTQPFDAGVADDWRDALG